MQQSVALRKFLPRLIACIYCQKRLQRAGSIRRWGLFLLSCTAAAGDNAKASVPAVLAGQQQNFNF